jgi:hypothetical protein
MSIQADIGALDEPLIPLQPVARTGQIGRGKQLDTLIRQKFLLKKREWGQLSCGFCGCPAFCPCSLFCELLLPIGLVLFLWWAQGKCVDSGQCELVRPAGWGADMPAGDTSLNCESGLPISGGVSSCTAWTDRYHQVRPRCRGIASCRRALVSPSWSRHLGVTSAETLSEPGPRCAGPRLLPLHALAARAALRQLL